MAEHRSAAIVKSITIDTIDLLVWTAAQRRAYVTQSLAESRVELLDRLPGWEWDADEFRWRQGFIAAATYVHRYRSLASVRRQTHLDGYPVGRWISRSREDYRANAMPGDRIAALEALPGWSWGRHQNWNKGLSVLRRFVADTGHASPERDTVVDGYPLGDWVTQRRREYKRGVLDPRRIVALQTLPGWHWDLQERRWRRGVDALKVYVAAHGHARPPRQETVNAYPVGEWVCTQRAVNARGRLSPERAAELSALPGWCWRVRATADKR